MGNKLDDRNRRLITRYFLIIFMLVGSVLAGTIGILYNLETRDYISRLELEERVNLKLQKAFVSQSLADIASDLMFLASQNELIRFFESGAQSDTAQIAKEYLAFARQKEKYDQIRFIDASGMEKVRVNFNNGSPVIVPAARLSPKGSRYYFKDTLALAQGAVFVSPFDLNIENGKIEQPLKPMIRFGTPVYGQARTKRGIVIVNYLGQRLINAIRETGRLATGDIMLVNPHGYWLCSPHPTDEWGFMLTENKQRKFPLDFPEAWAAITAADVCQFSDKNGLFTAATVYPLKAGLNSSSGSAEAFGDSDTNIASQNYYWKIISHVPAQRLNSGTRGLMVKLFLLAVALFLFAAIPSWFIAQSIVKRKLHQLELYRSAHYDKLTDLPNRALFLDRLSQNLKQANRYKRRFALLFIDLDGFKAINDSMGHDAGDELLIKVSQRLLGCVRDSDTASRLGGDEFTVILSAINAPENAENVARKIITALRKPFTIKGQSARIGASIGISVYPDHGDDTETLLKKADNAMYRVKETGKNGCRLSEA